MEVPPVSTFTHADPALAPFVPRKIFLKGWCPFGKEASHGLNKADAKEIADRCLALLPQSLKDLLDLREGVVAPFHRNRQLSFSFVPGVDAAAAYHLSRTWNENLRSRQVTVRALDVYVVCDAPMWKKEMRSCMARALHAAEAEFKLEGDILTPDWAASSLWMQRGALEDIVGRWDKTKGWRWLLPAIHKFDARVELSTLDLAMASR